MKVIQIVPGILDEASGTSHSVPGLCQALANKEIDLELHVNNGHKPGGASYKFYAHGCWNWPPRLDWSPKMSRAAREAARGADILHSHGLWNMANIYSGWAVRGTACRLVISPRGTLSYHAMSFSRWKKTIIYHLWQRRVLNHAACFHATSQAEYEAIRGIGLSAPVALIPNGIDVPDIGPRFSGKRKRMRRLLFLGRITPIKKIDNLLKAWLAIQEQHPDWELHITGVDDRGHESQMKMLAKQLGVERVTFTGPVYGKDKTRAFLEADLFVLPSCSENFGMAVAETLAHGVPAIVTKGAPWEGLDAQDCGWWIEIGVEPLIECLKDVFRQTRESLSRRGANGRKWMERDYSWTMVGDRMLMTYNWLLHGGAVPKWVRLE